MYISLPIIFIIVSIVLAGVSFLLLMLFSENPKRNTAIWLVLTIIGTFGFFASVIWFILSSVL
ncbi:hypothetical protein C4565_03070 [Candidatus Parcubacteria bacterium]|nr:MAG: hypothetical protein C4565_03070 [Candidatus Parcubacteria bacterium]